MAKPKDEAPQGQELEVVNPQTGEVMTVDEAYADYEADAGTGFENQTSEDVGIPYLVLMQPMSPEVSAEGSVVKPGFWVNRGTNEFTGEGVEFIPSYTRHVYREWNSKEPSGAAPVGDHAIDSPLITRVRAEQPFGDYTHPDNPEHPLVETFEVFGVQVTKEGGGVACVITFSSTHIKAYKDFMLKARSIIMTLPNGRKINPPLFAHVYRLGSKRVEKKPHVWWVPEVRFADLAGAEKSRLLPQSDLYQMAKSLHQAVSSGEVKAAAPTHMEAGDAGRRGSPDQEDAPY